MVETRDWLPASEAPEGVEVETKIDDADGVLNVQPMTRRGRLWYSDGMYVYYTPTHFRPLKRKDRPDVG